MPKGFVILTEKATAMEQVAIHDALSDLPWWHYTPQAWLVFDRVGTLNAGIIRDRIRAKSPGLRMLVIEAAPGQDWAAFAPPEWTNWLNDVWKRY